MPGEKSSMKISSVSVDRKTVVDCTKMVITITVVAYLAWLPALVMILLLRLPVQGEISIPAVLYAMSSTTLTGLFNPIIYGIFSASYRNGYRGVVRSFFHLLCGCRREDFDMIDDVTTRARRMRSAENTSVSSRSLGGVMSPSGTLTSSSSAHVREILLVDDQQDEYQPVANQMMSFNSQYSSLYAANGRNAGSFQNKPKISGGGVHVESAIEEEAQDSVENSPLTPRRFAKFSKFQHYIFSQKRSKYNNANNRRRHHREIESNSSLLTCTSDDDEASDDMSYDSDGADGCTDKKPNRNGKFSSDNIQIEESEI